MTSPVGTRRPIDRVRVGVLGLGAVAQAVHLPLLRRLPDQFEIAAIADLSSSLTQRLGEHYQVPTAHRYGSLEDLLETAAIDAVLILTSGSHGRPIATALDHGLAVFAEKPLAYTLAEADAIGERLAADPASRLQVGYMKLYDPAVVHALRWASANGLGEPRAVEVTVLHPTSEAQLAHARLLPPPADIPADVQSELAAEGDAQRRVALGPAAETLGRLYTNVLLGSVVHELALVRAFAGDPTAIDAATMWHADPWPPSVELAGPLANGGRISIRWHFLADYPSYREEVRVVYETATAELSFPAPYLLHRPTELRLTSAIDGGRNDMVWTSTVEAFEEELLAFHAFIVDGRPPAAALAEGRADIVTCQRTIATLASSMGLHLGGEAAG